MGTSERRSSIHVPSAPKSFTPNQQKRFSSRGNASVKEQIVFWTYGDKVHFVGLCLNCFVFGFVGLHAACHMFMTLAQIK